MAEKVIQVLGIEEVDLQQAINNSVNQFITHYFGSARIASEWQPVLSQRGRQRQQREDRGD